MSYDLQVYAPDQLDVGALRNLVSGIPGLEIDGVDDRRSLTVVRGVRRRYSFTIDGPERIAAEDVPAEVTGMVLGARHLYSVVVEGSAESEIPHALRFAKQLTVALDGAMLDVQTGRMWSRSRSRAIARPSRKTRVATVDLVWCCLREQVPADAPELVIAAAERHLPEALPRRFGEYEPLQGKYSETGREGFSQAWRAATSPLFFSGSGPCIGGYLGSGPGEQYPDRYWSMSLQLLADPLKEAQWREVVRDLFTALADTLGTFYASAEVIRDNIWSGRSAWSDGRTERVVRTLRHLDGWLGLSPIPPWWSWFGSPYASVAELLPGDRVRPTSKGVFFESAPEPLPRDQLEPLSRWLPADLFARIGPNPGHQQPVPLIRAAVVPKELS
ncbi:hypothetical protein [Amycolatopsis plumensis]|uniref:Uncharacterized protein n=2 Tax=Amycolatopsis plumensis TaxID=236508 RepID=A0ABV5UC35_9PSEU